MAPLADSANAAISIITYLADKEGEAKGVQRNAGFADTDVSGLVLEDPILDPPSQNNATADADDWFEKFAGSWSPASPARSSGSRISLKPLPNKPRPAGQNPKPAWLKERGPIGCKKHAPRRTMKEWDA